jgi:hypothetical protein
MGSPVGAEILELEAALRFRCTSIRLSGLGGGTGVQRR